jgi:hypothetical protein
MTQALYAHMNNKTKQKKNKVWVSDMPQCYHGQHSLQPTKQGGKTTFTTVHVQG